MPTTPDAPTKKSADSTHITIEWVKPSPRGSEITGYVVYWNGGGTSATFEKLGTTDANVLEYTHLSTDPGSLSAGVYY